MPSNTVATGSAYRPSMHALPTFSQFANVFMLFGVALMLALLVPETEQNLLKGRIAYTIWASLLLATPALCLYVLPNPTPQRQRYANLFYTFAYLAYLPHFYYTAFVFFGGFEGMWQKFSHPIAISNLVLTVWWPIDIVLAWSDPKQARWLAIERFFARLLVFMSFFLSAVIFMPGPVKLLGALMTVFVGSCLLIRVLQPRRDTAFIPRATPAPAGTALSGAGSQPPPKETTMTDTTIADTTGVQFTETMRGFFSTRETQDFDAAEAAGRQDNQPFAFTVTITTTDIDKFIGSKLHEAKITGTATAPALSPEPLRVTDGDFNLFVNDSAQVNAKQMRYQMRLMAVDGKAYFLTGFKTIRNDPGFDVWGDTTTLRIKVYEGNDASGAPLAAGILKIAAADFMHQLTTMKAVNARNMVDGLHAVAQFGKLFAGALYETYGGVLLKPNIFNPDAGPREKRKLDLPGPPEVYHVDAGDGVMMVLTRYRGGKKGPVMCVHGLGVNSAIFSTDLIDRNLLEELVANKYDVWLLDYRSSINLPYAAQRYTADEIATKDFPAAVAFVRQQTGAPTIQCLVHCFGATTFFMAMLAGLQGVRSAAVSQIATHMKVPFTTKLKAVFHAADFLDKLGVKTMTAYVDTHEQFLGRLADQALKLYPVHDGPRDISPVSRRISFLYGQLYEINQLNEATYDNLHELFGVAGIASLEHLGLMIRKGHLVDFQGNDVYLQEAQGMPTLRRLAIPIAIAHGELNKCWEPISTEITIDLLKKANNPALYERKVIPGYGHIDCIFGKNAAHDVYPFFIQHLDKTAEA